MKYPCNISKVNTLSTPDGEPVIELVCTVTIDGKENKFTYTELIANLAGADQESVTVWAEGIAREFVKCQIARQNEIVKGEWSKKPSLEGHNFIVEV